jgi:Na+-transporting NADH:ubiquinone oxidoreductase subunit D
MYDMSKQLNVFLALIITNCIVLGRAEAFAMKEGPWRSFLDGLGNALGYGIILVAVAAFREFFGSGSLMGYQIISDEMYASGYQDNGLIAFPPGAFIILGLIIWVQRTIGKIEEE